MTQEVLTWLLTAVGLAGFYLAGRKVWWCWYVNLACQALWVTYALVSRQPAFLVSAAVYTVVFGKNAISWTKEHRERKNSMYIPMSESAKRGYRWRSQD